MFEKSKEIVNKN